jgi:hypothetical protein
MTPEQGFEIIDTKLYGITGRVQLIFHMQRDKEGRFAELTRIIEMEHESIEALERVTVAHEQRPGDIDGH